VAVTRLGVVGYGTGGQHFHTPFIEAAEGVGLVLDALARASAATGSTVSL